MRSTFPPRFRNTFSWCVIPLPQITEGPEAQHGFQTTSVKFQTSRMAIFCVYGKIKCKLQVLETNRGYVT